MTMADPPPPRVHPFDYYGRIRELEARAAKLEAQLAAREAAYADRIAQLERERDILAESRDLLDERAKKVEAERDAVVMLLSAKLCWTVAAELMSGNALRSAEAIVERLEKTEAQVAAARAECARLVDRPWSRWAGDAGRDVLRAMDEAKP